MVALPVTSTQERSSGKQVFFYDKTITEQHDFTRAKAERIRENSATKVGRWLKRGHFLYLIPITRVRSTYFPIHRLKNTAVQWWPTYTAVHCTIFIAFTVSPAESQFQKAGVPAS